MGATGAEFTDILIDPDADRDACIKAAWEQLRAKRKSDIIILPYVRSGAALKQIIYSTSPNATVEQDVAVFAHLQGHPDWQSYYNSLSKSHRKKARQPAAKAAELGTLQFEVIQAGDQRCPELIRWMLAQKRVWGDRTADGARGSFRKTTGTFSHGF